MSNVFPQIKIKKSNVDDLIKVKRLKKDLKTLKKDILSYIPSDFNEDKLNRIRIRIYRFPRREACNEFFIMDGRKKYVCVNSSLINRRYYTTLLYTLHGISHSFCHLKDGIAEEAFCEYVSYSILNEFLKNKGKKFSRKIIRGAMNFSPTDYNKFYRAARKLEKRKKGIMSKINVQSKNRKISKKKQRKIFFKLTKMKQFEDDETEIPELERGFKKV